MKSFLISKNVDFQRTHNLDYLLSKCASIDQDFSKVELGNLNYYGIEVKYGDEFYLPSLEEARKSFELALKVKSFVLDKLELSEESLR